MSSEDWKNQNGQMMELKLLKYRRLRNLLTFFLFGFFIITLHLIQVLPFLLSKPKMKTTATILLLYSFLQTITADVVVRRKVKKVQRKKRNLASSRQEFLQKWKSQPETKQHLLKKQLMGGLKNVPCLEETLFGNNPLINIWGLGIYSQDMFTCSDEFNCDLSHLDLPICTQMGGIVVRDTLTYCSDVYYTGSTITYQNVPSCLSASCGADYSLKDFMYDLMIPFHQEAWYYSDDQIQWIINAFGFGDCGATSFSSGENDDPCHEDRQLKQKEKFFGWGGAASTKAPMQVEGEASASGSYYMPTYYKEGSSKAPQSTKCSSQQFAGAMSDAASVKGSRASILVTVFLVLAM